MEQLQQIWDDLKDKNEIAIIEKHGNNAKRYTTIMTSKTIFSTNKFLNFCYILHLKLTNSVFNNLSFLNIRHIFSYIKQRTI